MISRQTTAGRLDKVSKGHDAKNTLMILAAFFIPGIINGGLFVLVGFRTLVPPLVLVALYVVGTVVLGLILRAFKTNYWGWKSFLICPTAINLFLVINYLGSSSPEQESYKFYQSYQEVASDSRLPGETKTQTSSMIRLENDAYKKFFGVRVFGNADQFDGHSRIIYTFEKGLFGLKVLKDYRFE
jgi:hypothetical protein